jgi:nucleoside phosphorylase
MRADVVILTALDDEYMAMRSSLLARSTEVVEWQRHEAYVLGTGIKAVLVPTLDMGQLNAALGTARAVTTLAPQLVILVGIAGCMREPTEGKVSLGDLVISRHIIDYELQKISQTKGVEDRWQIYRSSQDLLKWVAYWAPKKTWLRSFNEPRPDGSQRVPGYKIGDVFSGNTVIAEENERKRLLGKFQDALAVEMEAAGVAAALGSMEEIKPEFLMIKSFTDWANGHKDDSWRDYACKIAAEFTAALIDEIVPDYLNALPRREENDELLHRRWSAALDSHLVSSVGSFSFLGEMAESILEETLEEIKTLVPVALGDPLKYRAELAPGARYLRRAKPFFARASRVFATSLDFVSTFWMDERTLGTAKQYLMANAESSREGVMRLFIFSTPEKAHLAARRLDTHARQFPNTFVCSKDSYEMLLRKTVPANLKSYLDRDFAILDFQYGAGSKTFFAELGSQEFTFTQARFEARPDDLDIDAFIQIFSALAECVPNERHPEFNILKWEPGAWNDRRTWADTLQAMFLKRTADVFHILSFKVKPSEYESLKEVFAQLKYDILNDSYAAASLAKDHGVKNVWLVRRIDREEEPVRDPHTHGALFYPDGGRNNYMMLMRIADQEKLEAFLKDERNLQLRLNLWSRLGGLATETMKAWGIETAGKLRDLDRDRRLSYEILERLAAGKMHRDDFQDDEMISEIVRADPPVF